MYFFYKSDSSSSALKYVVLEDKHLCIRTAICLIRFRFRIVDKTIIIQNWMSDFPMVLKFLSNSISELCLLLKPYQFWIQIFLESWSSYQIWIPIMEPRPKSLADQNQLDQNFSIIGLTDTPYQNSAAVYTEGASELYKQGGFCRQLPCSW